MTLKKAQSLALRYLSYRPRTCKEVHDHLAKKEIDQDIIEEVLDYLSGLSYLDDENFCELWIRDRVNLKPMGKIRISQELQKKGVSKEIIDASLEEHLPQELEYELALELAKKRISKLESKEDLKEMKKMQSYLYRRGFNSYIINEVSSEVWGSD